MPHKKQIRLARAADIPPLPTPHREPGRAARFLMREFPHALPLNRWAWGLIGAAEYTVSLYIYGYFSCIASCILWSRRETPSPVQDIRVPR